MMTGLSRAAQTVGRALARWNAERRFAGRREGSQFKAEVDREADELWRKELQAFAPGTHVVSEEDERHAIPSDGNYWLIDPLDGTASFVGGFSGWVTQAVWMENHQPVASVVFAPMSAELIAAKRGEGAFRNGARLSLDGAGAPASLVDNYPTPRGIAATAMRRFGIGRYVESGSIGLKICRVATAEADVFVKDVTVKSWDVAPGDLILGEAGGALTTLAGQPFDYRKSEVFAGLIATRSAGFARELAGWAGGERHLADEIFSPSATMNQTDSR